MVETPFARSSVRWPADPVELNSADPVESCLFLRVLGQRRRAGSLIRPSGTFSPAGRRGWSAPRRGRIPRRRDQRSPSPHRGEGRGEGARRWCPPRNLSFLGFEPAEIERLGVILDGIEEGYARQGHHLLDLRLVDRAVLGLALLVLVLDDL